jgi:tetratricopeptide (TPR) repeat protein
LKLKLLDLAEMQHFIHVPLSSVEDEKEKADIGFHTLGDLASNAVPALIEIDAHPSSEYSKEIADYALIRLYPAPCVATPYWVPPSERVDWYVSAGEFQSQSGAPSNAILAFSRAIELDPANVEAYRERGNAKIQIEDLAGAIADLNKALELSPSNETAFFLRGLCKLGLGRVNTKAQSFDDEGKHDESGEQHIQFVEPTKDPAEALEPSEEAFDFVSPAIDHPVICPRGQALRIGRHHGNVAQLAGQAQGFIPLIGAVHNQMAALGHGTARL